MRGEEAGEARRVECFFSQYHNSTLANSTLATQRSPAALGADDPFFFLPFAFRGLVDFGADVFGGAASFAPSLAGRRSSVGGSTRFAAEDFAVTSSSSPHASDS